MTRDLSEAERLRAEIADATEKQKQISGQIRRREGRLRRIAADVFNEESARIDGVTVELREIVLGAAPCDVSPIGVCVYSNRVMSIPGQRAVAESYEKHGHILGGNLGQATFSDACLFCGVRIAPPKARR